MTDAPPRPQPHAIEAEQALLGALLLNNDVADRLVGLEPEHFYDPVHGEIYALVLRRIADGKIASVPAIRAMMSDHEGLNQLGGHGYLTNLVGAVVSIASAPQYAEMIVDLARRRRMLAALQEAQEALPCAEDPAEVLAALEAALAADETGAERESGISFGGAMKAAIDGMNAAFQGGEPAGIDLGIPALTAVIGRARPGDVILLAGRPSMGKSAVAIEIARRVAQRGAAERAQGKPGTAVVYWCHEMVPADNGERMLTAHARDSTGGLSYRDARDGRMTEAQFRSLIEAGRDMERLPAHFVESSVRKLPRLKHELRRHARRFQRQGYEVLLVLDYLQQIDPGGRSRFDVVTEASMGVKALAIELRCPALVLSQLSRKCEDRDPPRPMLGDLRESGQIEQDANTVLLLYRDEYYLDRAIEANPDDERAVGWRAALDRCRGMLEIIVPKQRSGAVRTVRVGFDGATNSIYQWGQVVPLRPDRQEGFDL